MQRHRFSKTSLKRLVGLHPTIIKVLKLASLYEPRLFVVEGMRSRKRQRKMRKRGKSKIFNSYHRYGLAVDLVLIRSGVISWENLDDYKAIHKAIRRAEKELLVHVIDNAMLDLHWKILRDYPHWQMSQKFIRNPRRFYGGKKDIGFT